MSCMCWRMSSEAVLMRWGMPHAVLPQVGHHSPQYTQYLAGRHPPSPLYVIIRESMRLR